MPKLRATADPEIVTPPTPLPIPSPTYGKEEGERYVAKGEVITEPRNRYVGETHAEIPEYEEGDEADYKEWLNKKEGE